MSAHKTEMMESAPLTCRVLGPITCIMAQTIGSGDDRCGLYEIRKLRRESSSFGGYGALPETCSHIARSKFLYHAPARIHRKG